MVIDPKKIEEWKAATDDAPPEMFDLDEDSEGRWRRFPRKGAEEFYGVAREAVPALLSEREELLALLREVEWHGGMPPGCGPTRERMCPACAAYRGLGHLETCRLAAFLR